MWKLALGVRNAAVWAMSDQEQRGRGARARARLTWNDAPHSGNAVPAMRVSPSATPACGCVREGGTGGVVRGPRNGAAGAALARAACERHRPQVARILQAGQGRAT